MAEPPISEAVSQAQGEQAAQQQLDDFRKNAAYNALVQTYGPAAGDPDAWAKSAQAKTAQDIAPYAAPTAQAELQGKQLGNADQTIKNQDALRQQQGQALYSVTQMAKSAANPDGSIDPDKYDQLFSNPLVQKATGVTPDQVAQAKPLITGPGGMQHLDSIATAALGPVKAQGAVGYGTDANGNPVQIGRDQYGRPIMQPLNGVTPTAVTNAQSGAANRASMAQNRAVLPNGQINQPYVDAKTKIVEAAARAGVTLTPEAINVLADKATVTGQLPTFGMGGGKNTAAVANAMASKGVTGDQLAENQQTFKTKQTALNDLARSSPTSAGGLVRAAGAVIQHMDTLDQFIGALQNKNLKVANALSQRFKVETGSSAPTNFDLQKQIVASELSKFLVGGRATLTDRKELQDAISKANSPKQLRDAIYTMKTDLGAQLGSLYAQYGGLGAKNEFLHVLTPAARTMMTGVAEPGQNIGASHPGGIVKITGDADFAKLPSGSQFIAPDGTVRVKH